MTFSLQYLVVLLSIGLPWTTVGQFLQPNGSVIVGQTFLAGGLDPTSGSTSWALTSHGISEGLFTVSQQGNIVGVLAQSVSKVSELVWEVTLRSGKMFSDGTAVTAQDVATCLNELNTANSAAQSSVGTMDVTAPSNLLVRISTERATHVMDAVLAEWVFAIYKRNGNNFVFTGPFTPQHVASDHIDLIPNPHYDDQAASRPNVEIVKYSSGDALATAAQAGLIDIGFHLPIHSLAAIRAGTATTGVRVVSFEVGYHYMAFHNIDRLTDVRVRRAIDRAIDRNALVTGLSGGHPTRSLFPDYSPWYSDSSSQAGNPTEAATLLDEAGWTLDASSGKRRKDGQDLTVKLVAYPQRPGLPIMQPLIAANLEALGITVEQVTTSGSSWDQLDGIMASGDYDLLMWAQNTLPAGDPLWFLNSFFRTGGGNNHAHFSNAGVDALLDQLSVAEQHQTRIDASRRAMAAILDEVPVSNLVTPFWHVSLSNRMRDYQPWGSDYYVIRSDLRVSSADLTGTTSAATTVTAAFGMLFATVFAVVAMLF